MKKSLILLPLAAVLLSLTGCKKDNEKSGPSGETVTLSATLGGGEKTEIYDGTKMKWSVDDAVNINGKSYTAQFTLDDGTYTKASFVGVERAEDGKYYAYYPASIYRSNIEGELPSTQTYHPENDNKLSDISPMYAVTDTKVLQFHNICALVKLQVTGEGIVKKIVVTSTDPLCGEFEPKTDDNVHYYAQIKGSGKEVTLKCGTGVALNATTPTTFYIALPQGELGNLTFKIGKSTSAAVNANLTAGKLYAKSMSDVVGSTPGALDGEFTVGMDGATPRKVNFSQGNLQYVNPTWQFAANQWDLLGAYSAESWDLFGWSTSATTYGMNTSQNNDDYSGDFKDWGIVYCEEQGITPGSNTWRTLTSSEWTYLFNSRSTTYGPNRRYAEVKVNGRTGILLFPDQFSWPSAVSNPPTVFNTFELNWNGVDYNIGDFSKLEAAGCVFLPAAGYRVGTSVSNVGFSGYYWSTAPSGTDSAYSLTFGKDSVNPASSRKRSGGRSVRLVLPVEN